MAQQPELNRLFTFLTVGHFKLPVAASRLRHRLPEVPQHRFDMSVLLRGGLWRRPAAGKAIRCPHLRAGHTTNIVSLPIRYCGARLSEFRKRGRSSRGKGEGFSRDSRLNTAAGERSGSQRRPVMLDDTIKHKPSTWPGLCRDCCQAATDERLSCPWRSRLTHYLPRFFRPESINLTEP